MNNDLSGSLLRERLSGWFTGVLFASKLKPCIIHFICVFSELFEIAPHFFLWMYPAPLHFWGTCEGGSTPKIKLFSPLAGLWRWSRDLTYLSHDRTALWCSLYSSVHHISNTWFPLSWLMQADILGFKRKKKNLQEMKRDRGNRRERESVYLLCECSPGPPERIEALPKPQTNPCLLVHT